MQTPNDDRFEMPWRPTYEAYGAMAWGASLLGTIVSGCATMAPTSLTVIAASVSAVGLGVRSYQTKRHFDFRVALAGTEFFTLPMSDVLSRIQDDHLWMGMGWEWRTIHTQRYYESSKINIRSMLPPKWYLKLKKIPDISKVKGKPWIHGLNQTESDIQNPISAAEGHTGVYGTTGSGKTRFLETLTTQIIHFKENVLIVIDPKGDKELKDIVKEACRRAGRPDSFIMFHPAFPSESIRFDPLKNWSRKTQIASRISMLMGQDGDSFQNFAWRSINIVADGLLYIGIRPTLKLIRKYVSGGPDDLTLKVLEYFFDQHAPSNWQAMVQSLIEKAKAKNGKSGGAGLNKDASPELVAYVEYYKSSIPDSVRDDPDNEAVKNLIDLSSHNREHYGKVIVNILPLLDMLCSDELGKMLSPNAEDMNDTRPIFDSSKVIDGKYVLYIGLDSLSDPTVGSALAGIILADLAAKSGEIYNYSDGKKGKGRIHLIVDEAAEAVNEPLIQLLNKGRGAGMVCWLLTQTFPDFIAKMKSEPKARQILGNLNNLITLRVIDQVTQKFISEQFGETAITTTGLSYSSGSKTEDAGMQHQASISQSSTETTVPIISTDLIGSLPDLHYISKFGGKIYKGRLAKLI